MGEDWPLVVVLVAVLLDLNIRVAALVLIPRNRKPSAAMAWVLAVFFIPYIGLFFAQRQADYAASLADMTEDIDRARHFVHVEFYIVSFDASTDGFFRAMEAAVARGVVVRLLLDHVASVRTVGHRETLAELDRISIDWHFMLPVRPLHGQYQRPNLRNHRKLIVIDGLVAHTGSLNPIGRSYNAASNLKRGLQWQELTVRITGPAAANINALFLTDWFSKTGDDLRPLIDPPVQAGGTSAGRGSFMPVDSQWSWIPGRE